MIYCILAGNPGNPLNIAKLVDAGHEVVDIRSPGLIDMIRGQDIFLVNELSDHKLDCTEDEISKWIEHVYSTARSVKPTSSTMLKSQLLKLYTLDLVHLMLPGTTIITKQNPLSYSTFNSFGNVDIRLKPSLQNSGRGHLVTRCFQEATAFVEQRLDIMPSGVIIMQRNLRRFTEFSYACTPSKTFLCNGHVSESAVFTFDKDRILNAVRKYLPRPLPALWRVDMVALYGTLYLNELEIVGAEYWNDTSLYIL